MKRPIPILPLTILLGGVWASAGIAGCETGSPCVSRDLPRQKEPAVEASEESRADDTAEEAAERGRLCYRIHCQNCHGPAGRGDGPMAEDLNVAVPDLTLLEAPGDGTFPEARLRMVIDGRLMVRGHGSSEMPIWGLAFGDPGKTWSEEPEIRGRIDDLLTFLETLQRETEDDDTSRSTP